MTGTGNSLREAESLSNCKYLADPEPGRLQNTWPVIFTGVKMTAAKKDQEAQHARRWRFTLEDKAYDSARIFSLQEILLEPRVKPGLGVRLKWKDTSTLKSQF